MKYFIKCAVVLMALIGPIAQASEAEVKRLNGVIDEALNAVYGECCVDHTKEEKRARVRSVIEAEYQLDVIIRRAIGRNWGLMKPAEQEQVLELVKQLVVKAYVDGLNGKSRPEIELGDVVTVSDRRMEIPSRIKLEDKTVYVLYRLGKMRSGWQIYDIVAEDISVVNNYRQQIDDHFRKGSGEELINKLQELLTKEDLNEDIKL